MAYVQRGAGLHHGSKGRKGVSEEPVKLLRGHVVVPNREFVLRVTFVPAVVWRVGEDQVRSFAGHQSRDVFLICGVADEQSVIAQGPQITEAGDRRLRECGYRVFVRGSPSAAWAASSQRQFFILEANGAYVKALFLQSGEFARRRSSSQPAFSASLLSNNDVGAAFCASAEMVQHDDGNFFWRRQLPGGEHTIQFSPAMIRGLGVHL